MAVTMIPPKSAPDFLARHGWSDAQILPLAGDASFRRYFRIHDSGHVPVGEEAQLCQPLVQPMWRQSGHGRLAMEMNEDIHRSLIKVALDSRFGIGRFAHPGIAEIVE